MLWTVRWIALILLLLAAPVAGQTTRPVETVPWTVLHDADRGRWLPVTVCAPRGQDALPLIVFSHGAFSRPSVYLPLAQFWASHGYICILPTHADSIVYEKRDDSNDAWPGPEDYGAWGKPTTQGTWKPMWSERGRDMVFLLRNTTTIERAIPKLRGRIDSARLGVGGHSLGAFGAMLASGATVDIPGVGKGQSFADPKLKIAAALLIAPQGRGQQGLTENSWKRMSLPMMVVTGEYDIGVRGEPAEWRKEPYLLSPPGDKYLLFFAGANHNSYFGQHVEKKDSSLPLQRKGEADQTRGQQILQETQDATLAFWDAYLKDDREARGFLAKLPHR